MADPSILPHIATLYGYIPSESACAIFIALFALSTVIHVGEAIFFRMWWLFPTVVLAGIGEAIGWAGRLWSSHSPALLDPYLMQICTTIIAPTPLLALNFVVLGMLIGHLGPQYSRLSPGWYTIVFCSADIVALVVQAVGGASASEAVETGKDPEKGGRVMLGGIAFQMAAISIYSILAFEFLFRYRKDRPVRVPKVSGDEKSEQTRGSMDNKVKLMIFGLTLSTLCIFIRSVYRTIELSNGWTGRIIHTQVYFNVLDGAMILIAIWTINFFHPGYLLRHITPAAHHIPRKNDIEKSSRDTSLEGVQENKTSTDQSGKPTS